MAQTDHQGSLVALPGDDGSMLIADILTRFHGSGPQRFLDHPDFWARCFFSATVNSTDQLAETGSLDARPISGFG
jgi:hypothetical protein